jgi:hypothetical protein
MSYSSMSASSAGGRSDSSSGSRSSASRPGLPIAAGHVDADSAEVRRRASSCWTSRVRSSAILPREGFPMVDFGYSAVSSSSSVPAVPSRSLPGDDQLPDSLPTAEPPAPGCARRRGSYRKPSRRIPAPIRGGSAAAIQSVAISGGGNLVSEGPQGADTTDRKAPGSWGRAHRIRHPSLPGRRRPPG